MAADNPLIYQQIPRPVGIPVTYRIEGGRLIIDSSRHDEMAFGDVVRLRLSYENRNVAGRLFKAKGITKDGRSFTLTSLNWRRAMMPDRQDQEYRAFVMALIKAIGRVNPSCEMVGGKPRLQWMGLAAVSVMVLLATAIFIWQALVSGAPLAALFGLATAAIGIFQIEPLVRRNRPRRFTSDAVPPDLLPSGGV